MKRDLSDSEWRLMKLLWERSPLTIAQMTQAVELETHWGRHTVISLLSRMEHKGAVRHEEGRSKLFYPVWAKDEALRSETRQFLDRVFGGNLGSLVHTMVDAKELTADDMAELKAILEKAREEGAK